MIEDIEYYKKKLETTTDPQTRDKLVKQIEILEEACEVATSTSHSREHKPKRQEV